jgi:hypothetical protein
VPKFGKLEARITVPTGGWNATVGGVSKTIPAGTYYMSSPGSGARDFLDEVAFQFGASSVVGSFSENGTGLVTITFSGATTITWVATDLRDILGFTGNLGSATSHVSTQSARGVWLPDVPGNYLNSGGHWRGYREGDYRSTSNPAGHVWAVQGQSRVCMDLLEWHGLKQAKTWIANETTVNQSLERFWVDGVWGEAAWGTAGGPIRWHPDATLDTDYGTYKPLDAVTFKPEQVVRDWVGLWRWSMPKLVRVPGSEAQGLGGSARDTIAWTLKEASSSTTGATSYATGSQTPNPNYLQVLDVMASETALAETPISVTGCGLTWELVGATYVSNSTLRRMSRWRAMGGAPTPGALTITFANAMTSCLWQWNETGNADTSGSNGAGAFVQTVTNTAAAGSTTINATLAALENAANSHLAMVGLNTNVDIVPDAQFTELGDDTETGPNSALETEHAANQTACDPTFTAAGAGILSSEIKARAV